MTATAQISPSVTADAGVIAYAAEVVGVDPEAEALLFWDTSHTEVKAAVKVAQARYGLSTESEWAEDFLSAHLWCIRNGFPEISLDVAYTKPKEIDG